MAIPRLVSTLLALAFAGASIGAPAAREPETFESRLAHAERAEDSVTSLRLLDSLVVEARVQNRADRVVTASNAHARRQLKSGRGLRGVRQEIDDALDLAGQLGLGEEQIALDETYADYWLAQGDPLEATRWLERGWRLALALTPPRPDLARHLLTRLADLHESIGQPHLADQATAWMALINDASQAPVPTVELQPLASTTRVPTGEIARTRLFLANASLTPVSGTLLLEAGDLVVKGWNSRGDGESITLQFPASAGVVPQSSVQGRRIILQPGESRTIVLELEPGVPPRVITRQVTVTWQAGASTATSIAEFQFRRPREFTTTSAANSCLVRLNPLVSVPVSMEIYHRGGLRRRLQDLLPVTSAPCRVELYEVVTTSSTNRQLLAVDANGDGKFDDGGDAVLVDRDRTGFPEVAFTPEKPVAALELRLYPLPSPDGAAPEALDLTVSLRDGTGWRVPPDVGHRIKTR